MQMPIFIAPICSNCIYDNCDCLPICQYKHNNLNGECMGDEHDNMIEQYFHENANREQFGNIVVPAYFANMPVNSNDSLPVNVKMKINAFTSIGFDLCIAGIKMIKGKNENDFQKLINIVKKLNELAIINDYDYNAFANIANGEINAYRAYITPYLHKTSIQGTATISENIRYASDFTASQKFMPMPILASTWVKGELYQTQLGYALCALTIYEYQTNNKYDSYYDMIDDLNRMGICTLADLTKYDQLASDINAANTNGINWHNLDDMTYIYKLMQVKVSMQAM